MFQMILKLTDTEIEEIRGKRYASADNAFGLPVTTIIDVKKSAGRQKVFYEYLGKLRKTPLSVFLLRFPYRVN
ncbi:hypothetical protein ACCY16_17695 [Candidatus Pantoea formicae]|uniref:hypothetical protein n=1 Tax=Candidatus Pantoea formicae TaxID=2608355 RepID=UPI003ED8A012